MEPAVRPSIEDFEDPIDFVEAMLSFRKKAERGFSILKVTRSLRRVSPALVSLVLSRKRTLTADRADEFAKLLALSGPERHFFRDWIAERSGSSAHATAAIAAPLKVDASALAAKPGAPVQGSRKNRKNVSTHLLNDWLNVFVKDLFQIEDVQTNSALAEKMLLHIATPKRVRSSINFLLREGHLRKTLDGRIVLDTPLSVSDQKLPSAKIRAFHKAALQIARANIDRVEPAERMAITVTVPVNESTYPELIELMEEFGEKLMNFATKHVTDGSTLYQVVLNASPVGGKLK